MRYKLGEGRRERYFPVRAVLSMRTVRYLSLLPSPCICSISPATAGPGRARAIGPPSSDSSPIPSSATTSPAWSGCSTSGATPRRGTGGCRTGSPPAAPASLRQSRRVTSFPEPSGYAASRRSGRPSDWTTTRSCSRAHDRGRASPSCGRRLLSSCGGGNEGMKERRNVRTAAKTGVVILGAAILSFLPSFPRSASAQDTLPPGYGTLKRDDIVVRFATDQLEIQVLPLAEYVIRLLAPDTYRSLEQLLKTKQREIRNAAQRAGVEHPTLVMVTFFGLLPQARFSPEDVNVTSRGRLFRPVGIVPLSPRWSSYQLEAHEQAVAIYLFEDGISFREGMTVSYQGLANDSWTGVLPTLDRERARATARSSLQPKP